MRKLIGSAALIVVAILSGSKWVIDGYTSPLTFIYMLSFIGSVAILIYTFHHEKESKNKGAH